MKLHILRNLGDGWPSLSEGCAADVDDATARRLLDRGLAVSLEPEVRVEEPLEAVPPDHALEAVPPARSKPKKSRPHAG